MIKSINEMVYIVFLFMFFFVTTDTLTWTKPHVLGIPPLPRSLHSSTIIGNRFVLFFMGVDPFW